MTLSDALMVAEIALLVAVVIQGEYIRFYEREVHRIQSDREKERTTWREQKRKQQTKKLESNSGSASSAQSVPSSVSVPHEV